MRGKDGGPEATNVTILLLEDDVTERAERLSLTVILYRQAADRLGHFEYVRPRRTLPHAVKVEAHVGDDGRTECVRLGGRCAFDEEAPGTETA